MSAKLSFDLTKLAKKTPLAVPKIIQQIVESGGTPPSWLGWLSVASGFLGDAITTDGDDSVNLPFNIGPEGAGLSSYWRTHKEWNDEAVFDASEAIMTHDVPPEFQATADRMAELIKFTTSAITGGVPPDKSQYRKSVDTILRESNSSGIRRFGDMLFFTLKLHRDR